MGTGGETTRDEWDAERVRALREWLASSQAGLADRLGTRQQTVSEWETGSSQPRRMSRRLLRMVAEDAGFYDVERSRDRGQSSGSSGDGLDSRDGNDSPERDHE